MTEYDDDKMEARAERWLTVATAIESTYDGKPMTTDGAVELLADLAAYLYCSMNCITLEQLCLQAEQKLIDEGAPE